MKKIIWILLFIVILPVKAETYYSDYSDYSSWSRNQVESSDLVDVEMERRYLYYHETIEGDYFIEGENPSEYPYIDKDKSITKTIEGLESYEEKPNQIVETKNLYYYKYVRPFRYIVISNISNMYNRLGISEIKVLARDVYQDMYVSCNNCTSSFESGIQNGNYNDINYTYAGDELIIDLNIYLHIDEFELEIFLKDNEIGFVGFDVDLRYSVDGPNIITGRYGAVGENDVARFSMNNMELDTPSYTPELVTDIELEPTIFMSVRKVTTYTVTNTYYYYYKIFKDHSQVHNDYYDHTDYSLYEDYYRYRTRDKVVIADNILIDNNQVIEDFVLEKTIDVTIEPKLDYSKNGSYLVNFVTPFKTIEKEVIIDRYENKYNELVIKVNEYLDELNKDKKIIGDLTNELDNSNTNLDKYIKEVNDYIVKLEDTSKELDKYKNKDELESYNKYIEELNNYNIEIEKLNGEINQYKQDKESCAEDNNRIKREYENEIINLRMSSNDKEEIKEVVKDKKCLCIPFIILWLLVIIMLVIIYLWDKKEKKN